LVEQLTFNQWVAGSNPARLTTYLEETYYSIGGGFVMTARRVGRARTGGADALHDEKAAAGYPLSVRLGAEMLRMGRGVGQDASPR
jgi:hypothetical protein